MNLALKETELSPRELAVTFTDKESYFVSEASTYRILKAHDLITSPAVIVIKAANECKDKTNGINQLWQTDITYLKIVGWGRFYLSTILDDYSRYIVLWKLCTNMRAEDVTDTLEMALQASGCDQVHGVHKPRLLSDNGSSYVSCDLEAQIAAVVDHFNHQRYPESLNSITLSDVYFGCDKAILQQRERIKCKTLETRRLHHRQRAAQSNQISRTLTYFEPP